MRPEHFARQQASGCRAAARFRHVGGFLCILAWLANSVSCLGQTETVTPVEIALKYSEAQEPIGLAPVASSLPTTQPFTKEPPGGPSKVRGRFDFHGADIPDLPWLWAGQEKKLYLDLNRNGDLTDDTNGVFVSSERTPSYAVLKSVPLPLHSEFGHYSCLVDIHLYNFRQVQCTMWLRSFYEGRVTLGGTEWQVGVVETHSPEGRQLLLRPWSRRGQPFSLHSGSRETLPLLHSLFFQGQLYDLTCQEQFDSQARSLRLALTPKTVPLGEVHVSGAHLGRLTFRGGQVIAVIDRPGQSFRMPTGSYSRLGVVLEAEDSRAYANVNSAAADIRVEASQATTLDVGGPLTNLVVVSRDATHLQLNYTLEGRGGETYTLIGPRKSPEFRILREGKQVAAGQFEFG